MSMTISNPDGKDFDFGDPEFWEFYGLSSEQALAIAEGFPEYWLDVAGWYSPASSQTIASTLAAKRRERNLAWLANAIKGTPMNPHRPNEISQHSAFRKFVADYYPEEFNQRPTFDAKRPFQVLYDQVHGACPSLEDWRAVSSIVALQNERNCQRRAPAGYKRRESLEDGLLFVNDSRLARQDVLEDLADQTNDALIRWGPLTYPDDHAFSTNYFVIGMPQSGKTTVLRLLIQSVLNFDQDRRLVVYDHKTEFIPVLTPDAEKSTSQYFYIFNPYDARSVGWDIAADVTANSAETLAEILIPPSKRDERPYFTRIPRNVLAEVIRILIQKARQANKTWTFLHLMLAIRSSNLRSVLSETSEGRETYKAQIQGDQQTQQNVRSELDDCSKRFLRIAAAWHRTPERLLSFSEWARSTSDRKGIILGSNDNYLETLQLLNQAILYFLCGKLMDQTHPKRFRTFMVLDEFERLGHIPKLAHTVETSAGRKLNLVFGVHDFETLKVHYDDMHGILGTCGFKAFLRVENPSVAEWISKRIGSQGVRMPHTSTSRGETQGELNSDDSLQDKSNDDKTHSRGTTTTTTRSEQYHIRRAVTPETIMALPLPSAGLGLQGFFQGSPYAMFYRGVLDRNVVSHKRTARGNECVLWRPGPDKAFETRSDADFQPPDDPFEPLRELGFERDESPHTAPLRSRSPSTPPVSMPPAPSPLQTDLPPSSRENDISDMPRRVKWNKDNNKFEF